MRAVAFVLFLALAAMSAPAKKQGPLDRFKVYKPKFDSAFMVTWPVMYPASMPFFAGLVEQESNWRERATLKTSREFGAGFGQFTQTFGKDGKIRMDVRADMMSRYKQLAGWKDVYDPNYQFTAIALLHKANYRLISPKFSTEPQRLNAMASAYNGGAGSVLLDWKLCNKLYANGNKKLKCDTWDSGVALNSYKPKTVLGKEYSKSAFTINREYPVLINQRKLKYVPSYTKAVPDGTISKPSSIARLSSSSTSYSSCRKPISSSKVK